MISVQPNPNSVIMENVRMLIGDQEAQCTVANFPRVFKSRRINKTGDCFLTINSEIYNYYCDIARKMR